MDMLGSIQFTPSLCLLIMIVRTGMPGLFHQGCQCVTAEKHLESIGVEFLKLAAKIRHLKINSLCSCRCEVLVQMIVLETFGFCVCLPGKLSGVERHHQIVSNLCAEKACRGWLLFYFLFYFILFSILFYLFYLYFFLKMQEFWPQPHQSSRWQP